MFVAPLVSGEVTVAIVACVISGFIGVVTTIATFIGLAIQKQSSNAAVTSSEAAQRANYLTEQRMITEQAVISGSAHGEMLSLPGSTDGSSGAPAHEPAAGAAASRPDVRWSLDRKSRHTFVLRNIGTETAVNVRIPQETTTPMSRNLPARAVLKPKESLEFLMVPAWGHPIPNEIYVFSDGYQDAPQVVPVSN